MKFAKILQDEVVCERRKASIDYRLGKKYLENFYADLEDCDTTQDLSPPPQLPATSSLSTLQPSVINTARSSLIEDNIQSQKVDPHRNSGYTGIPIIRQSQTVKNDDLPVIFMFLLCLAFYFDFGWDRTAQDPVGYHYPLLIAICIILAILLYPFPIFKWEARRCFLQSMGRIFVSGYNRVEFLDYSLADEMNSLTYSIEQFELAICAYSIRWHDVPQFCTSQMWATPLVTALPACFRFLQCLRHYHDTFEWCPHLLNAGKYLTSLVQLFVYFIYRNNTSPQTKAAYILISLITNTYSYTWDVYMDWGLFQFEKNGAEPAGHPLLRAELIYSQKWVYYFAIVEDFVGRFAWIVRLIPTDLSPLLLSFIIASVELLRRWIWNFFRVENEYLNNCNQLRATKDILLRNSESETEDEKDNDCRSMSTFKRPSSWFDSDGIGTKW
ncbi:Xenotropic and polytropic retrovirus receptor 1 [Haplosporangium sp. Z 11]|nr:Xenotropic and polytropic retrovirus receptor 1 [Haplosporangium sp. Z 11]